jgi:hypothetical protein
VGTTTASSPDSSISVDIAGLAEFARALRLEVDANLRPFLTGLVQTYNLGVTVGNGVASPRMHAAREHYQSCLASIIGQLDALAHGTAVLADTAGLMAAQYRNADTSADASLADLASAITTASSKNPASPPTISSDGTMTVNVEGGRPT